MNGDKTQVLAKTYILIRTAQAEEKSQQVKYVCGNW